MGLRRLFYAVALILAGEAGRAAVVPSAPLFFIEDAPGRFLVRVPGTAAMFSREGVEFWAGGARVHAIFQGANQKVELRGVESMGHANFLAGQDSSTWRTGLATYRKIRYANLYHGIDLTYSGTDGRVKSEYRVAPGADPQIYAWTIPWTSP